MKAQMIRHATLIGSVIVTGAVASAQAAPPGDEPPATAAEGIRIEATRSERDPIGRPLPLAAHWTCGWLPTGHGFAPRHQMELIAQGHHLLPWFGHPGRFAEIPPAEKDLAVKRFHEYFEGPLRQAAEWKLPIGFIASQWESVLSGPPYLDLPADRNPNIIGTNGVARREVSPFGPVAPWREVGQSWTGHDQMRTLQEWYPDPPRVFFISNNEHGKLTWAQAETCQAYVDRHGLGKDNDFKRQVIAEGWIERYRALQGGMRDGLTNPVWRAQARFVGYNAFGLEYMGRWGGWKQYALCVPGRLDPNPLMWDGGSPSYYTHNWNPSTDYTAWSPQVEFMNCVVMHQEAHRLNPEFWLELSVWDGYVPSKENDKRAFYRHLGQTYTPERYAAWLQFGMWLLRPRAMREYRDWNTPWLGTPAFETPEPYFMALLGAVDRVHTNRTLRAWWRKGELVANRAHPHPYQNDIPPEVVKADRWFMLDADCNPAEYPWETFWSVPVFALALTRGQAPEREWLIYAHAPLGDRRDVALTIPGYTNVVVSVPVAGAFFEVAEKTGQVRGID